MLTKNILSYINYNQNLVLYPIRLIQTKEDIIISSFNRKGIETPTKIFTLTSDNRINVTINNNKSINPIKKFVYKYILPHNYPQSVKPGYIHFTLHLLSTNTLINAMSFLSTQMLINKLGLSTMKTIKLSAGLNWVLKNGIGQITSFIFASNLSQAFERNTKQWRVVSVLIGNSALFIEMLCNKLTNPYHILLFASIAQALKLCGIFGISSSQIGINHHFCKENNITDLQRKYLSQNQIGFFLGSVIGLIISLNIGLSPLAISRTIFLISLIYIFLAYRSIREISFESLNMSRSKILFEEYISKDNVLSMDEVNKREGALFRNVKGLTFGCSIEKIIHSSKDKNYLRQIMNIFNDEKWLIYINLNRNRKAFEVMTSISEKSTCEDIIEAFYSSMKVVSLLNKHIAKLNEEIALDILKNEVSKISTKQRKEVIEAIKAKGYDFQKSNLENKYQRYTMDLHHIKH